MLWKKASERNLDFELLCSLEVMGARDLGKIKITYIVSTKGNINLTQSLLLNNFIMTNLKILGFFVLLSLTLTLEINSHQAPASNQVSKEAFRTWFALKQLKPLLLTGEVSKIQLKALEAALIENLDLVKKTIKAVETAKPKPANKTQAKPSGKTPADTKTHKNDNKAPSGTKVPPIQTKPSKPENKTSGSKSTTQSKTGGSSKVETPKNKTSASGNKKSTTPSGKTPAVETKHKNHENKTKPQEKKPIVNPPHSKDHSKKVHTEDDSSSSTEEQAAVKHNLNKRNPNAIAPRSYTPKK